MVDLKFTCPTTGRMIASGIETDSNTLSQIRSYTLKISCPHCAETHRFPIESGRFEAAA